MVPIDATAIKQELDEIRDELKNKQDKVRPALVFTFFLWVIGVTVSGSWWAATTSAQLHALEYVVERGMSARYTQHDAEHDFKLRDQRLDFLQNQLVARIKACEQEHTRLHLRIDKNTKRFERLGLQ